MMAVFIYVTGCSSLIPPTPEGRPVAHTASFGSLLTSLGSCPTKHLFISHLFVLVSVSRTPGINYARKK